MAKLTHQINSLILHLNLRILLFEHKFKPQKVWKPWFLESWFPHFQGIKKYLKAQMISLEGKGSTIHDEYMQVQFAVI